MGSRRRRSAPVPTLADSIRAWVDAHRSELIPGGIAGVIIAAVVAAYQEVFRDLIVHDPGFRLYITGGLCVLAFLFWALIGTRSQKAIGWRMMLFWLSYCLIFWSADVTSILSWRRPQGFHAVSTPREWSALLPVHWGDWRYRFVGAPAVSDAGRVVLILKRDPPGATREWLRSDDVRLVKAAFDAGAKVIGIDASYEGTSGVDSMLCGLIQGPKPGEKVRVVTAYEMQPSLHPRGYVRYPRIGDQPKCARPEVQGQAMSLVDSDGLVRVIPLYWKDWSVDPRGPAFSLQVAMNAGGKISLPTDGFLRIVRPRGAIDSEPPGDILSLKPGSGFLGGAIVILGSTSPGDRFSTPFDSFPGAELHAFAVFDLLHGYYIRQCPALLSALIIFGACFVILVLWSRGATLGKMAKAAAISWIVIFALSAALMHFFLLWVEVIYAIVAVSLLVPILHFYPVRSFAGKRRLRTRKD